MYDDFILSLYPSDTNPNDVFFSATRDALWIREHRRRPTGAAADGAIITGSRQKERRLHAQSSSTGSQGIGWMILEAPPCTASDEQYWGSVYALASWNLALDSWSLVAVRKAYPPLIKKGLYRDTLRIMFHLQICVYQLLLRPVTPYPHGTHLNVLLSPTKIGSYIFGRKIIWFVRNSRISVTAIITKILRHPGANKKSI